jgi:hypothetical protein
MFKLYILERNICTFDLSSPIEAFQFASFLVRLLDHANTLKDVFDKKKAAFLEKANNGQLPCWTKEAQAARVTIEVVQ